MTPALFVAAVLASAMPAPGGQESRATTDPNLARRLHFAALDRQAEFDYDSALVLLQSARSADPSNLAVHDQLIWLTIGLRPTGLEEVRREYAPMPDSPLIDCLRAHLAVERGNEAAAAAELLELESRYPGEACPVVRLSRILVDLKPEHEWDPRRLEYLARAVVLAPEVPGVWTSYTAALTAAGRFDEAEQAYAEAASHLPHPIHAVPLQMRRAGLSLARGDVAGSEAL